MSKFSTKKKELTKEYLHEPSKEKQRLKQNTNEPKCK